MTAEDLERRLAYVEKLIAEANPKDLPYLNDLFQKLLDRLVALDLAGKTEE